MPSLTGTATGKWEHSYGGGQWKISWPEDKTPFPGNIAVVRVDKFRAASNSVGDDARLLSSAVKAQRGAVALLLIHPTAITEEQRLDLSKYADKLDVPVMIIRVDVSKQIADHGDPKNLNVFLAADPNTLAERRDKCCINGQPPQRPRQPPPQPQSQSPYQPVEQQLQRPPQVEDGVTILLLQSA